MKKILTLTLVVLAGTALAVSNNRSPSYREGGDVVSAKVSGSSVNMRRVVENAGGNQGAEKSFLFFTAAPTASTSSTDLGDSGWIDTRGYRTLTYHAVLRSGSVTLEIDSCSTVFGSTPPAGTGSVQQTLILGTSDVVNLTVSPLGTWTRLRITQNGGVSADSTHSATISIGGVFRNNGQ